MFIHGCFFFLRALISCNDPQSRTMQQGYFPSDYRTSVAVIIGARDETWRRDVIFPRRVARCTYHRCRLRFRYSCIYACRRANNTEKSRCSLDKRFNSYRRYRRAYAHGRTRTRIYAAELGAIYLDVELRANLSRYMSSTNRW